MHGHTHRLVAEAGLIPHFSPNTATSLGLRQETRVNRDPSQQAQLPPFCATGSWWKLHQLSHLKSWMVLWKVGSGVSRLWGGQAG